MALLFDPKAEQEQAFYQGLLGLGANLLAANSPRVSTQPGGGPGMGAAIGQGLLGFQQGQQGYMRNAMQQGLFGMQMDEYQRQQKKRDEWERAYGPGTVTASGIDGAMGNTAPSGVGPQMSSLLYALGPEKGAAFLAEMQAKDLEWQNKLRYEPGLTGLIEQAKNPAYLARKEGEAGIDLRYKPILEQLIADARVGPAVREYLAKANVDLNTKPGLAGAEAAARLPAQKDLASFQAGIDLQNAGPRAAASKAGEYSVDLAPAPQPYQTGGPTVSNAEALTAARKQPSDGQLTATGYANRALVAHQQIAELENAAGKNGSVGNPASGKEALKDSVPFIGGYLTNEQFKSLDQSKRNFINAVLRKESGAAIGSSEFANAEKQYFPQPADTPAVIEQKRQNREMTVRNLQMEGAGKYPAPGPQPSITPQPNIPQDILLKELQRRGLLKPGTGAW